MYTKNRGVEREGQKNDGKREAENELLPILYLKAAQVQNPILIAYIRSIIQRTIKSGPQEHNVMS